MLVYKRIPLYFLIKLNWKKLLFVLSLGLVTWYLSTILHIKNPTILLPSAAVYGAILSIFLAFRTNEAYSRWWEARTLWGSLVNSSRSFTRELIAYFPDQDESSQRVLKKMVLRHLAYINALRISLRNRGNLDSIKQYLDSDEYDTLINSNNIPTQLVKNQSIDLRTEFEKGLLSDFQYVQINSTLNQLYDIQGGCERIKNTVFPRLYSYYTTAFTVVFAILLIVSLVDEFDWQIALVRILVAYVFLVLNELGISLKNPFENQYDDTPMSSLCRTIEIDLKEMIGEPHDLKPLKAEKGILD